MKLSLNSFYLVSAGAVIGANYIICFQLFCNSDCYMFYIKDWQEFLYILRRSAGIRVCDFQSSNFLLYDEILTFMETIDLYKTCLQSILTYILTLSRDVIFFKEMSIECEDIFFYLFGKIWSYEMTYMTVTLWNKLLPW